MSESKDKKDIASIIFQSFTKPKVTTTSGSVKLRELRSLYNQTLIDYQNSVFAEIDGYVLVEELIKEAIENSTQPVNLGLVEPFFDAVLDLATEEAIFGITEVNWNEQLTTSEQIEIKNFLKEKRMLYNKGEQALKLWSETLRDVFVTILQAMPIIKSSKRDDSMTVSVINLLDNPQFVIEKVIFHFFSKKIMDYGLFSNLRGTIDYNTMVASGLNPNEQKDLQKDITFPTKSKLEGTELVTAYFRQTILDKIFNSPYPLEIPIKIRLEHTHILAGTGYGKTQLIQKLILDDLKEERGFCVIDSQNDLIRNVTMLAEFDPQIAESLSEKIIIIDPTDIDYPACLNIFAMSDNLQADQASTYQKELMLNATVDLYTYIFGALFGAELTAKQGTVFAYIARLMMEIPKANIQTLRELLEDGRKFKPYMEKLEGSARAFFQTQFFSTSFGQSKKQVLSRLWAVLSNATLERLFSNVENKVDVYGAISEGKILLVNTSKDLLQREGSAILGRFFIALLSQAIIKRGNIPESRRKPYMIYIDEAHEYFDYRFEEILNQARKYKVGFTISHQNLGQLHELRSTVASSTSVKMVGGVSANDAKIMALEMRTSSEEILAVRKRQKSTEFVTYLKNLTPQALPLTVQFGLLEKKPVMPPESFQSLIENNRNKYCHHISQIYLGDKDQDKFEIDQVTKSIKPPTKQKESKQIGREDTSDVRTNRQVPKKKVKVVTEQNEGKGGVQHRYLQNLVKKIGNERGFTATIEKQVLSGTGLVDVMLEGYDEVLAVEISVSTEWKWEASNVSKCLATGVDKVIILSSDNKHLQNLRNNLSDKFLNNEQVMFFTANNLISFLDEIRASSSNKEKTVRGYKVKVKYASHPKNETKAKKKTIAKVLAGVMK